jgi:dTDP-4-dehydrorhamnose 3,5-epimerase
MAMSELKVLQPQVFSDDRGYFFESYNQQRFEEEVGDTVNFVQDNQSYSVKGVLRGLHYQVPPHPQGKLVRCVEGAVWDVAVDIRRSSPTFRRWFGVELSAENKKQLWLPEGMAHGFLALSEEAEILYKTTEYYAPDCDRSIRWNDPEIDIKWPLEGTARLSEKDRDAPFLADADVFP